MADKYAVDPAALAHDAGQFHGWSEALAGMSAAVPLDLDANDFSTLPGAGDALATFHRVTATLRDHLDDGADHLEAIATRLTGTARIYTDAEDASASAVTDLTRKLDSL